jgi:hypothetical protein
MAPPLPVFTDGPVVPAPVVPQVQVPAVQGVIQPGAVTAGVAAHLPLVTEVGAFRVKLRDFLRTNGKRSKLNPARMAGTGPLGQSTMGGNGLMGDPHVQTHGARAGSIVQGVRLGGRTYHIYFHADGQREVVALPKGSVSRAPAQPAPPTGGTVAPY